MRLRRGWRRWAGLNTPVAAPDFNGRIAGLAFSPFHRGQSPEDGSTPEPAEIRDDLARAAAITGRMRTYTVAGDFAAHPRARGRPAR